MEYLAIIILAAAVFGVCFLADKLFSKLFRGTTAHRDGKSVRHNSRTAAFGLIVMVVGLAALFAAAANGWLFVAGGVLLIAVGGFLVVQYMSFGIFYLPESFVYTSFGKRSIAYSYKDIISQQLYNSWGNVVIELHMADGSTVMLQSGMNGVYPFLDQAFDCWLRQTGRKREECSFHDPQKCCWFPPMEG